MAAKAAVVVLLASAASRAYQRAEGTFSNFHSRPDLRAPILHVYEKRAELVQPGYFFLAPYGGELEQQSSYIYDNDGDLVWSGFGAAGPSTSQNLHVCEYESRTHLCVFQGEQRVGWSRGHGLILDESYRIVASVEAGGSSGIADMHVFDLVSGGGTAIVTTYRPHQRDLTPWGLDGGIGWILESGFQEIDVETGVVLFGWASLDHVPPEESQVMPSSSHSSGTGLSSDEPWDYFHINSVDKMSSGDYVISARHTSTIYRVSNLTGEIVWRIAGAPRSGDYTHVDGANFSFQHDARIVQDSENMTTLSVLDNAANLPGQNTANRHTSGKILQLNHRDRTVRLLKSYPSPRSDLSSSQGNMQLLGQILPASIPARLRLAGNAIICWGNLASFTEVVADTGEMALDAGFDTANTMLYSVYKANWTGQPLTLPALWTYSLWPVDEDQQKSSIRGTNNSRVVPRASKTNTMMWYASWNGATEIRRWRLLGSTVGSSGPWTIVEDVQKQGFETSSQAVGFYGWAYVEALDNKGQVLGSSNVLATFVPGDMLRLSGACDEKGCRALHNSGNTKGLEVTEGSARDMGFGLILVVLVSASVFIIWLTWRRK